MKLSADKAAFLMGSSAASSGSTDSSTKDDPFKGKLKTARPPTESELVKLVQEFYHHVGHDHRRKQVVMRIREVYGNFEFGLFGFGTFKEWSTRRGVAPFMKNMKWVNPEAAAGRTERSRSRSHDRGGISAGISTGNDENTFDESESVWKLLNL
eukprot:TRINITY_DN6977_c0_g1_i3.p1 TRINITY_DN6977_c0_g1~~TRINITY_DN6977_c0_g1_i3.p1  ORF type:complete len:154 (+),score=17.89 TRINITY_DN6977_c0_g1_i3:258-719(+)